MREKLLHLLATNARLENDQLAAMLESTEQEVADEIAALEKEEIIKGYQAIIDWDRTDTETVSARIEIKVVPQRDMGFDEIAGMIAEYPEVSTLYLMSGSYDLGVTISGKSFKDIAMFTAKRLAPIEAVQSTSTHFVLCKYKERGIFMNAHLERDEREVTTL